jgi:hypothetical protein
VNRTTTNRVVPVASLAAPGVAAHGVVVWAAPQPDGAWGVAVKFMRRRFLYAFAT